MGFFSDLFGGDSGPSDAEKQNINLQNQINTITLQRLKREELELGKAESERQSILESGRRGRKSLFTRGFLGPGSTPGQIFKPRFNPVTVATAVPPKKSLIANTGSIFTRGFIAAANIAIGNKTKVIGVQKDA